MFSRKTKEVELRITQSEFDKIQVLFDNLKAENKRLQNAQNQQSAQNVRQLNDIIDLLAMEKNKLSTENRQLIKTLEVERHTTRAILNKLQEVTNTYEHIANKEKLRKNYDKYVTSLDLKI
jgi:FtsZ-binding cell division protein ZapB